MKRKFLISGIVLMAIFLVVAVCFWTFSGGRSVDTEAQAIEIAKEYMVKRYGQEVAGKYKYCDKVTLKDGIWKVSFTIHDWNNLPEGVAYLGGEAYVLIRESTGKVVKGALTK